MQVTLLLLAIIRSLLRTFTITVSHFPCAWLTLRCSITASLIHHKGKNHMLKYRDIWRWRLDRSRLSVKQSNTRSSIGC